MKFNEAMKLLEKGSKIARQSWKNGIYWMLENKAIISHEPRVQFYQYNENTLLADGWIVEDSIEEQKFYDIISDLKSGKKARMKDWKESYIYFDHTIKNIALHTIERSHPVIDFSLLIAEDWIEIL